VGESLLTDVVLGPFLAPRAFRLTRLDFSAPNL